VFAVLAGLAAGLLAYHFLFATPPGFISEQQYRHLRIGQAQSSVIAQLGPPLGKGLLDFAALALPRAPAGLRCTYYQERDAMQDPDVFRLCYARGVLAFKALYLT
jgi:hypothetical protein